jgi:eukaryotic-like serine/threonine-protein kinase
MSKPVREREIFEVCLGLNPEERDARIADACRHDPELGHRVRRLLEAHDKAEETSFRAPFERGLEEPSRIGPYRILRVLGEGGMGVVYEAEQTEPVVRRVALKLIQSGLDSRQVVARFEAERQALAVMEHPNIARVLDAGTTAEGRPFFVMELVDGVSLTDYCDRHRLPLRQRLELFLPLCLAVQHAHQKGVIHRDLKPSNVLIVSQDGRPAPKIIDFGIAKALDQASVASVVTQQGAALGTPAYMSPEQAEVSRLDVDTRSDIFSLGVMLYELLVGTLPVDPREVGLPGFLSQLTRNDHEPPTPSARLRGLGDRAEAAAARRDTDSATLLRELEGDLDWIVMKAMEKDRRRRYETPNALGAEIRRYLNEEPIVARPPSLLYRLRKFGRRQRPVVAVVGVALVAVAVAVIGVTLALFQAMWAQEEAEAEARRALQAEEAANLRLRGSLLDQARAIRRGNIVGRRLTSLALLSQASGIRPGSDLRDEAIAALMLTDLRTAEEWSITGDERSLTFNPSLTLLATGFPGGRLEIRHRTGEAPVRVLPGFGPDAWVVQFSLDNRLLAVKYHGRTYRDDAHLRVWDLETEAPLLDLETPVRGRALHFSPDGLVVAYGDQEGRLMLRNVRTGVEQLRVKLNGSAETVRFRPDGRALALGLGDPGGIEVRNLRGEIVHRLSLPSRVYAVDWSGDGTRLAGACTDGTAVVWEPEGGADPLTLKGHKAEVVVVSLHPREPLLATHSWDETSRVWDTRSGEQLLIAQARALEFSRDGKELAFVTNKTLGVWEVLHGESFRTLHGHTGKNPVRLDVSPDGRWIASGGDDGVLLWGQEDGRLIGRLETAATNDLLFHPTTGRLVGCGPEGLKSWDWHVDERGLRQVHEAILFAGPCAEAKIEPSGRSTLLFDGSRIRIHSPTTRGGGVILEGFPGLASLALSPQGRWVAGGNWRGDRTLVWNTETGEVEVTLLPGQQSVRVGFSPDGAWLAAGGSEHYYLWRTESWEEVLRIPRPQLLSRLPGRMAFSADSKWLAVALDQQNIRLLHLPDGTPLATLEVSQPQSLTELRFTPDRGKLVASALGNSVLIWDLNRIRNALRRFGLDDGLDGLWPEPVSAERP